jgi:hypothetical protein
MNADDHLRTLLVETPEPFPPFTGTVEEVTVRARRRRRRNQIAIGVAALLLVAGIVLPLSLLGGLGGGSGAASGTAAFVCPETSAQPHKHQVPGTLIYMVPGGPESLTACRYHGLNQPEPPGTLAGTSPLPSSEFAKLLNGAKEVPPNAVYHCPDDFGEVIDLYFRYSGGSILEVRVPTRGCRFATNGDRSVFAPPALLAGLTRALGSDGQTGQSAPSSVPTAPPTPKFVLPVPPQCPAQSEKPTDRIKVSTVAGHKPPALTDPCIFAPADQDFQIVFSNRTVATDGSRVPENLSIYSSEDDAVSVSGNGQVLTARSTNAIFRGRMVLGPRSVTYSVPALAPGTYWIQSDYMADRTYGILTVG